MEPEALDANSLRLVFDTIYLLAVSAWLGSILFFSFAIAPMVFQVLDAEHAGKFLRAFFPRYYLWGAICGALALPCAMGVPLAFPEYRGSWVGLQAVAIIAGILVMLYCGNSLTPAINAAKDAGPAGEKRFKALHGRSVLLNSLVMLLGLALLIAFAARQKPRSSGIVEPSPVERALLELKQESLKQQNDAGRRLPPATGRD